MFPKTHLTLKHTLRAMASRRLSRRGWIGALLELFIIHISLIIAVVISGIFVVTFSNMMSGLFTMYFNSQKFISDFVNKNVELIQCHDLCKITLSPTHNTTSQNVTKFLLRQKIANITIVNPQNVLVFVNLKSDGQEKWVYTSYDARITVFFTGNLSVSIYPTFPLSDARPRKLAFQENGTRTVHVSSQLGNVLNQLFPISTAVVSALAAIGIIKRVMATPASDVMSKKIHPSEPLIALFYLVFSFFVVLFLTAVAFYIPRNPWLLLLLFLGFPILLSIGVLFTGRFWPGFTIFLFITSLIFCRESLLKWQYLILTYVPLPDILGYMHCTCKKFLAMWQLLFSLKLDSGTILLILLFYLFYPLFHILGKGAAFAFSTDRMFKLYLMYIYDIAIMLWIVQWFLNPYPAMLEWDSRRILESLAGLFLGLPSLIYQGILDPFSFITAVAISWSIFLSFVLVMSAGVIAMTRGSSLYVLNLPGLPQSLSLTARYIRGFEWLLPAVPFVLNRELVARGELCASAERGVVRVRVYPEDCCDSVEGVVVDCSLDKIAVDGNAGRRVFSWGDVRQIELVG